MDRQMGVERDRAGASWSCARGCAACCTQLVFIHAVEAVAMVHAYVHTHGAESFETVVWPKLETALALARELENPAAQEIDSRRYMEAGVPCAFLGSDKTCTIYRDRPLACRTLVVVSDPAICAQPEGEVARGNTAVAHERATREHVDVAREEGLPHAYGALPAVVTRAAPMMGFGRRDG